MSSRTIFPPKPGGPHGEAVAALDRLRHVLQVDLRQVCRPDGKGGHGGDKNIPPVKVKVSPYMLFTRLVNKKLPLARRLVLILTIVATMDGGHEKMMRMSHLGFIV